MKTILAQMLIYLIAIEPAAFAGQTKTERRIASAPDVNEQMELGNHPSTADLPLTKDQMKQLEDARDKINSLDENEILGGKIVNKDKEGTEIYSTCVQSDAQGRCVKVQYIYRQGIIKSPITDEIDMQDLRKAFDHFKSQLNLSIQKMIDANQKQFDGGDLLSTTKSDASSYYYNFMMDGAEGTVAIFVIVTIGLAIALPVIFVGGFVLAGIIVAVGGGLYYGWPVLTDFISMPFRIIGQGIKAAVIKIHNKRVAKKKHKTLKRIQLALEVSIQEGSRVATLSNDDFDFLLDIFKQTSASTRQTNIGSPKP